MPEKVIAATAILQPSAATGSQPLKMSPVRGRHTLRGGCISSLRVKACPLLLPASSCWEKQSQSEVILFRGISNPQINQCSYWAPGTAHFLDHSGFLHTLVPSFSACYINQINLVLASATSAYQIWCLLCACCAVEKLVKSLTGSGARCLLGGLPIWSLSEQVAQPTLVSRGDAWTC